MKRFFYSPLVRMSLGLTMLTVSMLFISDMLGLIPDTKYAELQSRKSVAESLAVQLSTEITRKRLQSIDEILRSMVERNEIIISVAVRKNDNELLTKFGDHAQYWTLRSDAKSTATQVQVPLFNGELRWGSVELTFTELTGSSGVLSLQNSFLGIILFVALGGFLAYLLFLKRALRELNPDAVIPDRVSKALDTLSEGLLIVDQKGHIVFSNSAFSIKMCLKSEQLLGKDIAGFDWENHDEAGDCLEPPWVDVLAGKVLSGSVTMKLKNGLNEAYIFTVNASPITATEGKVRGVLITFDDITEVEAKNEELRRTLLSLENSQNEISRQNQELQVLAARDPLTGALNRRSLFQGLSTLLDEAQEEGEELSCIMVDIDHFKSVNDQFGHAVGDEAIKALTHILTECSRSNDLVGRLGGEEFLVVLPETDIKVAALVAERMRLAVEGKQVSEISASLRITSSFGIATLSDGALSSLDLVDRADKAMYVAKENGRNRVISWSSTLAEDAAKGMLKSPLVEQVLAAGNEQPSEQEFGRGMSVVDEFRNQDGEVVEFLAQNVEFDQALLEKDHALEIKLSRDESKDLANTILLMDRIEQGIKRTQRDNTQIAVLVMDVGTLQRVNDTLGLATGEKLAKLIVTRLKQTLRLTDTVAMSEQDELLFTVSRLGSSEMAVLLTDLDQAEIVTSILQRIFSALKKPVEVESNEIYLNVNVGVSVFPLDGRDPETLIRNASSAMREAKQNQGGNNFRFYAEDINHRAKQQIQLEAELHRAVEREELIVYYQPKVDLRTGNILSMEALVRWQHPLLGIVPPNDFIPLAEQTGLIEEVSRCVIRAVCRQISFWQKAGYGTVRVAVNLSPVEFRTPDLADQIIALVDEFAIPASALEIEITETAVMQSMDAAAGILEKLSAAGFCISLDDFGTGYSSLSYLKRFPVSTVKIDRSFITDFLQNSDDAVLVSAIIAMSHSLGLRVVAEGVETDEQLRFLQDLHCDEIQGYLISRPVPSEEISDLLTQSSRIRRMVLGDGANHAGLMPHQTAATAHGMIGILNDFPAKDVG